MKWGFRMAGNKGLNKAKDAKNDEFYTQIEDIERELSHYREAFKGKVVFCNCDDPEYSNFWRYFQLNFYELGLKQLISTHYEEDKPSYRMDIVSTDNGTQCGIPDYVKTPLQQNGDFRSPESIEILKQADIIITNPPFSLFREFIALLMEYNKKFIVIGHQNAIHYKEIFPLLRDNKMWLGYGFPGNVGFFTSPYEDYAVSSQHKKGMIRISGVMWFSNIDIEKRHEDILLYRQYSPEEYITYDNFDAINVDRVADIPCDYYGKMGVPDNFLEKYNPDQFVIIGMGSGDSAKQIGIRKNYRGRTDLAYTVNGKSKCPYSRIIIQRRVKE